MKTDQRERMRAQILAHGTASTIVTFDIATKKGRTLSTSWHIRQEHPCPDLEIKWGHQLAWRNAEGLFPRYPEKTACGIGRSYRASLLRNDKPFAELNLKSRESYAGYADNKDKPPAPGSIVYRGVDLGEVTVTLGRERWHDWRVRGWDRPTPSEREFLDTNVAPALLSAIEEHRAVLKAEAVQEMRDRAAETIEGLRKSVKEIERAMRDALADVEVQP